jgi:aspartate aminotransferase
MKMPMEDEKEFCDLAKEFHLILVPGSSFKCKGYVRIAYCVSYETIRRSQPAWKQLAEKTL